MSEIFLRTNLDINNCIFSFKLSSEDYFSLKNKLNPTINLPDLDTLGVAIPKFWQDNTTLIEECYYVPPMEYAFCKLDEKNYHVYGWIYY